MTVPPRPPRMPEPEPEPFILPHDASGLVGGVIDILELVATTFVGAHAQFRQLERQNIVDAGGRSLSSMAPEQIAAFASIATPAQLLTALLMWGYRITTTRPPARQLAPPPVPTVPPPPPPPSPASFAGIAASVPPPPVAAGPVQTAIPTGPVDPQGVAPPPDLIAMGFGQQEGAR